MARIGVAWRRALAALPSFAPEALALAALWAVHVRMLLLWLTIDSRPPRWDESIFLMMTEAWRRFFIGPNLDSLNVALTMHAWKSPPAWLALVGLLQAMRGGFWDYLVWISNSLAFALLIVSVYLLGRFLYGRLPGAVAAGLITLYAGIGFQSRLFLLDLPQTAAVALAIYAIARLPRRPLRPRDLVFASLAIAFAVLVRWQALFFLWGPALFVLIWRWRDDRRQAHLAAWANIRFVQTAIALGAALVILGAPLLYLNYSAIVGFAATTASPTATGLPDISAFHTVRGFVSFVIFYPQYWTQFGLVDQPEMLVLAAIGAVVAYVWFRWTLVLLAAWLVGAYLPLTLLLSKDPRYDLPYLAVFALLSVAPLALQIRQPFVRQPRVAAALVALLLIFGGYELGRVSWYGFGIRAPLQAAQLPFNSPAVVQSQVAVARATHPDYGWNWLWPAAEDWHDQAIVELLSGARQDLGLPEAQVAFVPRLYDLQVDAYRYFVYSMNEPLTFVSATWLASNSSDYPTFFQSDFVVTKTGFTIPREDFTLTPSRVPLLNDMEAFARNANDPSTELGQRVSAQFVPFARRSLPDGSEAILLVRRSLVSEMDALRDLPQADVRAEASDYVSRTEVAIEGERRAVLFEHPPLFTAASTAHNTTSICYRVAAMPADARLRTAVALLPDAWDVSDGVEFAVRVAGPTESEVLYQRLVNPRQVSDDRSWQEVWVDLSGYAGQNVQVCLETGPGPSGDNTTDWAVWAEPRVLSTNSNRLGQLPN